MSRHTLILFSVDLVRPLEYQRVETLTDVSALCSDENRGRGGRRGGVKKTK